VCRVPSETFDLPGYTSGGATHRGRDTPIWHPASRRASAIIERLHRDGSAGREPCADSTGCCRAGRGTSASSVTELSRVGSLHDRRLRRWFVHKHKVGSQGYTRFPDAYSTLAWALWRLGPLTLTRP